MEIQFNSVLLTALQKYYTMYVLYLNRFSSNVTLTHFIWSKIGLFLTAEMKLCSPVFAIKTEAICRPVVMPLLLLLSVSYLQRKHPQTVVILLGYRDYSDLNALVGHSVFRPVLCTFLQDTKDIQVDTVVLPILLSGYLCVYLLMLPQCTHTSFFSSRFVIITMIGLPSCHTILQKSPTVLTVGPWVAMYAHSSPPYPWTHTRKHFLYYHVWTDHEKSLML